jgi:ABC-type multidrug transport system ATPase subunit
MVFVEKIELISQTYPGSNVLSKDFNVECSDVNLFVGDQGCGKSTLLKLLQTNHSDVKLTFSDYVKKNGVDTFYFNSEIDNPRIKDPELFTKPNGEDVGIGYGGALISRFKSHGEVLEKFIINPLLNAKKCVILLDEPESGLSITNQFKLIDAIKTAVNNNCQLFIATHCYPIIEQFNVISLEHNQQMIGVDFITKIKNSHK